MINLAEAESLADLARMQARAHPDWPAMTFEGRTRTFAEVDGRASRIANALLAEGIEPGARVAWLAKNCDSFFEMMFGACKARAVLTPINYRLAALEIGAVLADSGAKLLFVSSDLTDLARQALSSIESAGPRVIPLDFEMKGVREFESWLGAHLDSDPMLAAEQGDDVLQLYTSGTTGAPKGVVHTNASYLALLRLASQVDGFNYQAGDTALQAMPQFHVAGVNVGIVAFANAARFVVIKDLIPAVVLEAIARERVNHAFFVPAVILMLLQSAEIDKADFSSMRSVSYGASPIAEELLLRARARFGCAFTQLYGMTETGGAGTYLPDDAHDGARLRSCGRAWPGVDVKIVDAAGAEVGPTEVGELIIRAPLLMKGYWSKPEATAEALRGGWMHTGDAAYRDEDGYFYIYDRLRDMIVTGGENVYPAEVENAIFGHPDVQDVAVIGVPHEQWGEAVKALVVPKAGISPNADAIIAWARERIANYKAPKSVDFIEAIPRNPSGKILRRELRKPYWEASGRLVG